MIEGLESFILSVKCRDTKTSSMQENHFWVESETYCRKEHSLFSGQNSLTGNLSYFIMTPRVQLRLPAVLLSSSVSLAKTLLSVISCWFSAVRLLRVAVCRVITTLTTVRMRRRQHISQWIHLVSLLEKRYFLLFCI